MGGVMFDLIAAIVVDVGGTALDKAAMIDLDKSAEIRGVDENKNDIRDDFERMLIKKVKEDNQRNLLYHLLRYMDEAVVSGSSMSVNDMDKALEIYKKYNLESVYQCLSRHDKSKYMYIEKNYSNNAERKQAYNNFNIAFSKNKYRAKVKRVDCQLFMQTIPDYVSTEFKANQVIQD